MEKIAGWVGAEDARRLFALAEEAKEIIRDRVARHRIDCDLTWGCFHGAGKPRQQRELAETREQWAKVFGYGGTRLVEGPDEVARYVATRAYVGGLYDPGAGHLHPLNYCLGLARGCVPGR